MHEVSRIKSSKPIPKILQKSQKLMFRRMKCKKMRELKLIKWRKTWLISKTAWGRGLEREESVWEVNRHGQIEEMKSESRLNLYVEVH